MKSDARHHWMQSLRKGIRWLTKPSPHLTDIEDQRRARLLALTLIWHIVIYLLVDGSHLDAFLPPPEVFPFVVMLLGAFYLLSRTRYYVIAALLYLILNYSIILYVALTLQQDLEQPLILLALNVLLASLIAPIWPTLAISIMSLLATVGLSFVLTNMNMAATIIFVGSSTGFIVLSAYLRDRDTRYIRQQHRTLAESEQRYQSLLHAAFEAIIVFLDGVIIDVNPAFVRIFGYATADAVIGQALLACFNESSHSLVRQHWNGEDMRPFEVLGKRANGDVFDLEIRIRQWVYDKQRAFVLTARDISERKRVERERRAQEMEYRALFEQTNDAVFIINLYGTIAHINNQVTELLGYRPEEMTDKPITMFVAPTELAKSASAYEQILAGERLPPYERIFVHKDGYEVPTEVSVTVVRGPDGEPTHIQSIVRDIRGRKEAEQQQLQLALERERVKVLQKFISDASHDFRTPLTNLKTSTFLLKALDDPQKRQHHLEVMDIQINRLERLLADMLVMSNLERHPTGYFQFGKVDTAILLREVVAAMQGAATQRQVHLHLQGIEELPPILADKLQIAQALRNIIENAVLYTEADGKIEIRAQVKKEYIHIHIKDTGMGIAKEDLPHIFESFYRADKARRSSTGGTGLGLPIAQKIIIAHQGRIMVESRAGEGSQFTIVLPLANISAEQQEGD